MTINFDHTGTPDEVWLSGEGASELMAPDWIENYSQRSGTQLAPVGATYGEHLTLLIAEDGSWYGGFDDEFGSIGSNFLDALENIILNKGFVERLWPKIKNDAPDFINQFPEMFNNWRRASGMEP